MLLSGFVFVPVVKHDAHVIFSHEMAPCSLGPFAVCSCHKPDGKVAPWRSFGMSFDCNVVYSIQCTHFCVLFSYTVDSFVALRQVQIWACRRFTLG